MHPMIYCILSAFLTLATTTAPTSPQDPAPAKIEASGSGSSAVQAPPAPRAMHPPAVFTKTFSLDGIALGTQISDHAILQKRRPLRISARHGVGPLPGPELEFGARQPALKGLTPAEFWVQQQLLSSGQGVRYVDFVERRNTTYNTDGRWSTSSVELVVGGDDARFVPFVENYLQQLRNESARNIQIKVLAIDLGPVGNVPDKSSRDVVIEKSNMKEMIAREAQLKDPSRKPDENLMIQQTIVTHQCEEALISTISQRAFITDYEVVMNPESMIADPVVEVIQSGMLISVTPFIEPSTRSILVFTSIQISNLLNVERRFEAKIANASKVTIDIPETVDSVWNSQEPLKAEDGSCLRVRGLKWVDDKTGFHAMEFWYGFEILKNEPAANASAWGSVIAVDSAGGTVVVEARPNATIPAIQANVKIRGTGGAGDAQLRVTRVSGTMVICTLTSGTMPAPGSSVE